MNTVPSIVTSFISTGNVIRLHNKPITVHKKHFGGIRKYNFKPVEIVSSLNSVSAGVTRV